MECAGCVLSGGMGVIVVQLVYSSNIVSRLTFSRYYYIKVVNFLTVLDRLYILYSKFYIVFVLNMIFKVTILFQDSRTLVRVFCTKSI